MKISDLLSMSIASLWRRKVRTILTVIGVVIGTTAIVVMISIGVGLNETFKKQLQEFGDITVIQVYPNYSSVDSDAKLDAATAELFKSIKHVNHVLGTYGAWDFEIKSGGKVFRGQIVALDFDLAESFGYKLYRGISVDPSTDGENIAMAGQLAGYFFSNPNDWDFQYPTPDEKGVYPDPDFDITSKRLRIAPRNYMGVDGLAASAKEVILQVKGIYVMDYTKPGATDGIIISEQLYDKLMKEYYKLNNIPEKDQRKEYTDMQVKVNDLKNVAEVEKEINKMGFYTYSMESTRKQMEQMTGMIQLVLGGLGAISMLVAALGIANTMIMSIYERTREIGVMKVLGCRLNDIRMMFLVEAGAIGLIGGVVGMVLSFALSAVLNQLMGQGGMVVVSSIPMWLVLLGLGFSVGVGLLAGFSPANRAVRISALSAIRQD